MDVDQLLKKVEAKGNNPKKSYEDKSFNSVMDSISKNWESGPDDKDEITNLKIELEKAQNQIKKLRAKESALTKNEEKILSAIRSESLSQSDDMPVISYNKFRKVYKVSSSYYRPSVKSLIEKDLIKQEEATFSGNVKTYRWKIIKK